MTDAPILLPYQRRWLEDGATLKAIEKSRRIGITWAESFDAAMRAAEDKGSYFYQSYDHAMTRGFVGDAANWLRGIDKAARAAGVTVVDEGGILTFRIEVRN